VREGRGFRRDLHRHERSAERQAFVAAGRRVQPVECEARFGDRHSQALGRGHGRRAQLPQCLDLLALDAIERACRDREPGREGRLERLVNRFLLERQFDGALLLRR
jgi:hypothetical protein